MIEYKCVMCEKKIIADYVDKEMLCGECSDKIYGRKVVCWYCEKAYVEKDMHNPYMCNQCYEKEQKYGLKEN